MSDDKYISKIFHMATFDVLVLADLFNSDNAPVGGQGHLLACQCLSGSADDPFKIFIDLMFPDMQDFPAGGLEIAGLSAISFDVYS